MVGPRFRHAPIRRPEVTEVLGVYHDPDPRTPVEDIGRVVTGRVVDDNHLIRRDHLRPGDRLEAAQSHRTLLEHRDHDGHRRFDARR